MSGPGPATRGILARIRGMFGATQIDKRLDEEMRFHVDMSAARNAERGASPEQARHNAVAAFGAREEFRERARDEFRSRVMHDITQDVRYALRGMRHRAGPSAIIILTLALGIGSLTTVFSVVNGVLLKPLPYAKAEKLVTVWQQWDRRSGGPGSVSPAEYFDYVDQQNVFQQFGVYTPAIATINERGESERVQAALVSGEVFGALGAQAVLGRLISPAEDTPGSSDVVVLTAGLWQRRYGGASDIIGRRIDIDGGKATVIGVAPDNFRLPDDISSPRPSELFLPAVITRESVRVRGSHFLSSVARLNATSTAAQASEQLRAIVRRFGEQYPKDYPAAMEFSSAAVPLQDSIVGGSKSSLLLLLAAVGCVLLIACVNATSLLLAQAETRKREMAVRSALGAARARLVRQMLVESVLLAMLACAGGIAFALIAVKGLIALQPVGIPRLNTLTVDGSVLLFAVAASAITAIASGLMPAIQLVRGNLQNSLRGGGRNLTSGVSQRHVRRALVAGEMAIAIVLLLGAGLLSTSFARLLSVDPGFTVANEITVPITLPSDSSVTEDAVIAFYAQVEQRIRSLPEVTAVGSVAGAPLVAPRGDMGVNVEDHPTPQGEHKPQVDWQVITPGYLRAMGMKLKRGRDVAANDIASSPGVAVINETMARKLWPGADPLGKRFTLGGGAKPAPVTVVGVVGDVRQAGLGAIPDMEMYIPHAQFRFWGGGGILRSLTVVINSPRALATLVPDIRNVVREIAPTVPVGTMRTMEDVRSASVAQPRFMMVLMLFAACVALVIAVVGLYGIVAYYVAQRRREIGMRVALGAQRRDISRLVLREGIVITAAGICIGIPAAIGFSRLLQNFLFDVRPSDPSLLVGVPVGLALVAVVASYLPARRAARVDPMEALRMD